MLVANANSYFRNECVEEMEGAATMMIAESFGVPALGIRVLSNNLTNGGEYDPSTARDCQEYALHIVRHFISTLG
eukprot:SAG31_NODE_1220_length_9296_cov_3.409046_4_plen_75_part_00